MNLRKITTLLIALLVSVSSWAQLPLNPSLWKITFPTEGPKGNALEILNPEFTEIVKGSVELPEDLHPYFQLIDDELILTSKYTGVTTSANTRYSRTELRQMQGAEQDNWMLDSTRKLECHLKVSNLLGGANKLFIMQIHGKAPESKPLLKVIWEKGFIRLLTKSGPKLKDFKRQQKYTEVGADTWFTCTIEASPKSIDVLINGELVESFGEDILQHWPENNTYYFKAGNYLQHDTPGAAATVSFSKIQLQE